MPALPYPVDLVRAELDHAPSVDFNKRGAYHSRSRFCMYPETPLANIASAKKRARQAVARRSHNMALRSRMRTYVKRTIAAIESGDKDAATEAFKTASSMLDSSATKGLIHRNKAARHKSRLNARIKQM